MSVQHLGRLLESGDYKRCLEEAEALRQEGTHDPEGLARIEAAICRSRLELTDYAGAVEAGQRAVPLAEEAGVPDVLGLVLVDLATAETEMRAFDEALEHMERYFREKESYTAARCKEGIALTRMGDLLHQMGQPREAAARYRAARRWFERYGDEQSAMAALRSEIQVHLYGGEPQAALPLLDELSHYVAGHGWDRPLRCGYLLDQALFCLVTEQYREAAQIGYMALEGADDRLEQQSQAHLILCQAALAEGRVQEALSFAFAARVSAIDGRHYGLEFEASDLLFRILRERGARMLQQLEPDLKAGGVNLYHYISERVVNRMLRSN